MKDLNHLCILITVRFYLPYVVPCTYYLESPGRADQVARPVRPEEWRGDRPDLVPPWWV